MLSVCFLKYTFIYKQKDVRYVLTKKVIPLEKKKTPNPTNQNHLSQRKPCPEAELGFKHSNIL